MFLVEYKAVMNLSSMLRLDMVVSWMTLPLYLSSKMLSWTNFSILVRSMDLLEITPDLVRRVDFG